MQYPVRTGPIVNDQAPFSPEMVAGYHPDRPSLFTAPRIPLPVFNPQLVSFSPEMVVGWHPNRPCLFIAPRIPLPLAQTTHVQAPFSPEMAAGSHPDRPCLFVAPRIPLPIPPIAVSLFSNEMVYGWHPDSPRLFLGPRIPLPLFDPSGPAPFSIDMVKGSYPDRARLFLAQRILLPISILEGIISIPVPATVTGIIAPAGRPGGKKKKFKKEIRPENHRPPGTPLDGEWPGMIWPSDKPQVVAPPATSKGETPLEPYRTPAAGPQTPSPELTRRFAKRRPKYMLPEFYRSPILHYVAAAHRERILAMVKKRMADDREEEDLLVLMGAFDD